MFVNVIGSTMALESVRTWARHHIFATMHAPGNPDGFWEILKTMIQNFGHATENPRLVRNQLVFLSGHPVNENRYNLVIRRCLFGLWCVGTTKDSPVNQHARLADW
jgi:hypothetical protein